MQKRNNPLLAGGDRGASRVEPQRKADPSDLRAAELLTDVYNQMTQFQGKTVMCHYRELKHAFIWQGETNYQVYQVELKQ